MTCERLKLSNYVKLDTDVVFSQVFTKFEKFIADPQPETNGRAGPSVDRSASSNMPGSLVLTPVTAKDEEFYWPAIVEFSPEREADYVRTVEGSDGQETEYYVTLITLDRSAWFGTWVKADKLKRFNVLSMPETHGAADVPDAEAVFSFAKEHLFMDNRDRLLKLSFTAFMAYHGNVRRWEIRY